MSGLNKTVKIALTEQKKEIYSQKYFDLSLELEIAMEIGDEQAKTAVTAELVKFKKVLQFLDKKLEKLNTEQVEQGKVLIKVYTIVNRMEKNGR